MYIIIIIIVLFPFQPLLLLLPYSLEPQAPTPAQTTLTPGSNFQTTINVVSGDNALGLPMSAPLCLSLQLHTWLAHLLLCACLDHTHHLYLCASYYMPISY